MLSHIVKHCDETGQGFHFCQLTSLYIEKAERESSSDTADGCWELALKPIQAVIKNADMAEDMQQDAIDCATQALEKRLPQLMSTFCSV